MEDIIFAVTFLGMLFVPLFIPLFAVYKAIKNSKREVLDIVDFKKNEELFRDIISQISPAVLSYIDTMKFDYSKAVTAVLLELKMEDVIKFDNYKIVKLKEIEEIRNSKIGEIEKYIFESITDGIVLINKEDLSNMIIKEAMKLNLLENNTDEYSPSKMLRNYVDYSKVFFYYNDNFLYLFYKNFGAFFFNFFKFFCNLEDIKYFYICISCSEV